MPKPNSATQRHSERNRSAEGLLNRASASLSPGVLCSVTAQLFGIAPRCPLRGRAHQATNSLEILLGRLRNHAQPHLDDAFRRHRRCRFEQLLFDAIEDGFLQRPQVRKAQERSRLFGCAIEFELKLQRVPSDNGGTLFLSFWSVETNLRPSHDVPCGNGS